MTSDEYVVNELLEAKKRAEWLERDCDRKAETIDTLMKLIEHLSPERLSTGTIYFKEDTVSEGDPGYAFLCALLPKGEE